MGFSARVFQPSTLRMLISLDASDAQNNIAAVSPESSAVYLLLLRLNASFSRSIALVVRALPLFGRQASEAEQARAGFLQASRFLCLCTVQRCTGTSRRRGRRPQDDKQRNRSAFGHAGCEPPCRGSVGRSARRPASGHSTCARSDLLCLCSLRHRTVSPTPGPALCWCRPDRSRRSPRPPRLCGAGRPSMPCSSIRLCRHRGYSIARATDTSTGPKVPNSERDRWPFRWPVTRQLHAQYARSEVGKAPRRAPPPYRLDKIAYPAAHSKFDRIKPIVAKLGSCTQRLGRGIRLAVFFFMA